MKRFLLFVLSCLFVGGLSAQDPVQQRFASEISVQSAQRHLTMLTSDEFAGRGTGAKGARITADYLKDQFQKMGLQGPVNGSFFQPVRLMQIGFEIKEFTIGHVGLVQGEGFYLQANHPLSRVDAEEIVLLGYGLPNGSSENEGTDGSELKNKVVMVLSEDAEMNQVRLQAIVAQEPKLILVVSDASFQSLSRFARRRNRTRVVLEENYTSAGEVQHQTAVAYLTEDNADRLLKLANESVKSLKSSLSARRGNKPRKRLPLKVQSEFGVVATPFADDNVLGYLPGTDPQKRDEVVVIMAHYDHEGVRNDGAILRGADDNGSGTTGLLEVARAFGEAAKQGHGPKRSLLFIGLCAEERGLLGSDYYTKHPVFPLENTVAALNMDMIGRIDDIHLDGNHDYIHVLGADKLSSELHTIVWSANALYTRMELDTTYNRSDDPQRLYYRSDHYNFAKHGVPSVFFFSGLHPDYHTPNDTIDKINFEMLVKRARLVFHTAWELANRERRIVVDSNKP